MRDLHHIMRFAGDGKAGQVRILTILHGAGEMPRRELTMCLGIRPGSASEILSRLEHAGLILRAASRADRRTASIWLTEQGTSAANAGPTAESSLRWAAARYVSRRQRKEPLKEWRGCET